VGPPGLVRVMGAVLRLAGFPGADLVVGRVLRSTG
jgi:alkylated DNA nucleotide flippase Atl1